MYFSDPYPKRTYLQGKLPIITPKYENLFYQSELHAFFFLRYFAFCLTCTNNLPEEPSLYLPAPQTSFLKSEKVPSTLELPKKNIIQKQSKKCQVFIFLNFLLFTNSKQTSYQMTLEAVEVTIY